MKSRKTAKEEDDDDESSISTSSSSSSNKVLKKMPMKPVAPRRPLRICDDEEAETKVVEVGAVEVEDEQQVKVKLELEPVEGSGKTETKVDFKLDVEVDPNIPGKEPLTTHLEGQVEGNEMDVEIEGKTKDDGNVVLEGSVQQGKDQDSDSGELDLVSKDEDETKLRHLSVNNAVNKKRKKKEEVSSSDSE